MHWAVSYTSNMEEIKRTLRRLILTTTDLSQAQKFVELILRNELYKEADADSKTMNRGLQTAAIVSYSRPFSNNYDFEHTSGQLSIEHLEELSEDELKLHEHIIRLRNKAFAHTDSDVRDLKIDIVDLAGLKTAFPQSHNPFAPFPKEQWEEFNKIIKKVDASVSSQKIELQKQLDLNESF